MFVTKLDTWIAKAEITFSEGNAAAFGRRYDILTFQCHSDEYHVNVEYHLNVILPNAFSMSFCQMPFQYYVTAYHFNVILLNIISMSL